MPLLVDGSHAVRINSIDGHGIVSRIQWSNYVERNGGYVSGEKQPWHDFPVTVKAHQVIRLGIILRKPGSGGAGPSRPWNPDLTVQWSALDQDHTDDLHAVDEYTLYGCG